jgi:hypothetical protein
MPVYEIIKTVSKRIIFETLLRLKPIEDPQ